DRVARYHDDGNISCCLLCRQRRRGVERHNYIDVELDQLGRELRKAIQLFLGRAKLEYNVFSLDIAKFAQSFSEICLEGLLVRDPYVEYAYSSHLRLLLARPSRPLRCR